MITLVREPAATTVAPIDAACTHCGLPVPAGYIEPGAERQFCCAGCRTAYAILHEHGLDRYYDLPERRDRPVRASGRQYDEFDHSAFHALYVSATADGLARVELYLEGVHCASCVWLVERVPLVVPGVVRAELNIRRSLATIEWDDRATPLSAIARALDSLGYPAHPFRGTAQENHRRREDRSAMVRIGVAGAISINVMLASLALYSGWWSGMEAQYARFFRWTALVLTIPALLWPGRVFFVSALAAVRARTLHMDLPIAVALAAGFARGVVNTVADAGPVYFDGVAMLVFLRPVHWTGPVAVGLALFALANLITEFSRAIRQRRIQLNEPLGRACLKTVLGNRRHYGGMIVHFGIVVIALGLIGSGLFRSEELVSMAPGDVAEVAGERLRFEGIEMFHRDNYDAIQGRLTLLNSGRLSTPERRRYPRQEMPTTETSIDSTMLRDVYVVLAESSDKDKWAMHIYVNPLVRFIWTGAAIILSGLFLSLSSRRRRESKVPAGAAEPAK